MNVSKYSENKTFILFTFTTPKIQRIFIKPAVDNLPVTGLNDLSK